MSDDITTLLDRARSGAAYDRDALFARLYPELRKLAHWRLRRNPTLSLLNTGSLVNEACLRLMQANELSFPDRARFFAYASSTMRSIIVDEVRRRSAERRGGSIEHVELDTDAIDATRDDEAEITRVHDALDELAALDQRLAQVVEMRYFGGLSEAEVALALGVTERTVQRDWSKARLLLFSSLGEG